MTKPSTPQYRWLSQLCNKHQPATTELTLSGTIEDAWAQAAQHLACTPEQLAAMIATDYGFATAELPENSRSELFRLVPRAIAERLLLFPLSETNHHLTVACADPFNDEARSVIGFLTAASYDIAIAPPEQIRLWIDQRYDTVEHASSVSLKNRPDPLAAGNSGYNAEADSAIVAMVSDMLLEAHSQGASDIHLEPFLDGGAIRYRIDGMLRKVTTLPAPVFVHMLQRVKATCGMNVATRLVPQDGGASVNLNGADVDLRVSTIPVSGGEKAVIRLLSKSASGTIDAIGLPTTEEAALRRIVSHPNGILLITGPTGSGKTTTLYSILKELNTFERCLVTVEDPVEYQIDGIAQIAVNRPQNVTFATALRAILRQDPDVVLVGETRDHETAEIAFQAALTGHLVMSTLHTNDAIATVPRLLDLQIHPAILADSIRGLASQRLVRSLCPHCASDTPTNRDTQSLRFKAYAPDAPLRVARGCDACQKTGYIGRFPLLEVVEVSAEIADAIRRGDDTVTLRAIADQQGNRPMAVIAADAIQAGRTSAEEVHRVMGEAFWSHLPTR
ncbi:GspE/PulE family protein [Motiliproteus sediminis]|uniref:GspE/PulE family protein n=1 Tax=Motiliproteus sediminis TaxID=1468178 RepID=UPI001AF00E0B|nr:GspE/PulE family protein [Motiliproteus sediminis]